MRPARARAAAPPDHDQGGVRERHRRHHGARRARPTPCCTCWPSPTRLGSTWSSTTSTGSRKRVPHIADTKPHGRYHMSDIDRIGGVPVVMKELLDAGLLHGDCLTVTGRTMAENLAELAPPAPDGVRRPPAVRPRSTPWAASPSSPGRWRPRGRWSRWPASTSTASRASARVFDGEDGGHGGHPGRQDQRRGRGRHPLRGAQGRSRHAGDAGRHRRHEGRRAEAATPRSSPTAASRAAPTASASATSRPRRSTAGRSRSWPTATGSSSTSWTTPIDLLVDEAELERRRGEWKLPEPRYTTGVLAKYAAWPRAPSGAPSPRPDAGLPFSAESAPIRRRRVANPERPKIQVAEAGRHMARCPP